MPSAAELKKQLEAAREAARRQEEELAKAMAEAEEAERVAAEAEARRLAEAEAKRVAEARRVAKEAEARRVEEEKLRQAVIRVRPREPAVAGSSQVAETNDSACWNCASRKLECVRSGSP